jgi:hypothetical protein
MSLKMIQERLDAYQCRSVQEEENALREITQEVALASLSRSDFFKKAAFQGGTCLRIFYSLERFSEDLDFILKEPYSPFDLNFYLKNLSLEFETYGYRLEVMDRSRVENAVKKAFLKDDSIGKILVLGHRRQANIARQIKIKIEVDTHPPSGGGFENKYHNFPFPFSVTAQDLPSLFAGKSHALLCREYPKGRDWYDFVWYASRKTPLNFHFLSSALDQIGPWKGKGVKADWQWYLRECENKIRAIDWKVMQAEVSRFLKPREAEIIKIWSADFFLDCLEKLKGQ